MANEPSWLKKWQRSPRQDRRAIIDGKFVEQGPVHAPQPPVEEEPVQQVSEEEVNRWFENMRVQWQMTSENVQKEDEGNGKTETEAAAADSVVGGNEVRLPEVGNQALGRNDGESPNDEGVSSDGTAGVAGPASGTGKTFFEGLDEIDKVIEEGESPIKSIRQPGYLAGFPPKQTEDDDIPF